MAIEVRHESGDLRELAGLAALAGMLQHKAPQAPSYTPTRPDLSDAGGRGGRSAFASVDKAKALKAQERMQSQRIQAEADIRKQNNAAQAQRAAVRGGLEKEMHEQEVEAKRQDLEDRAAKEADMFEWKMGKEEEMQVQKIKRNLAAVEKNKGDLKPEEYRELKGKLTAELYGVKPSPQLAGEKPPTMAEQTEMVNGEMMIQSSSGPRHIPYDKTREGIAEAEAVRIAEKKRDDRHDAMVKFMSTTIEDYSQGTSGPPDEEQIDKFMDNYDNQVEKEEKRQAALRGEQVGGSGGMERRTADEAGQPAPEVEAPSEVPGWTEALENKGIDIPGGGNLPIKVRPEFAQMRPEEGQALSVFDSMYDKWQNRDEVPPRLRPLYDNVSRFAKEYLRRKNRGQ